MGLLSWIFYMIVAFIFFLILLVLDHKYKLTKLGSLLNLIKKGLIKVNLLFMFLHFLLI